MKRVQIALKFAKRAQAESLVEGVNESSSFQISGSIPDSDGRGATCLNNAHILSRTISPPWEDVADPQSSYVGSSSEDTASTDIAISVGPQSIDSDAQSLPISSSFPVASTSQPCTNGRGAACLNNALIPLASDMPKGEAGLSVPPVAVPAWVCPAPPYSPEQIVEIELRTHVHKIYAEFNPSKCHDGSIDSLFSKYAGKEVLLYWKVCKKYGVTPLPEYAPEPAVGPLPRSPILPDSSWVNPRAVSH